MGRKVKNELEVLTDVQGHLTSVIDRIKGKPKLLGNATAFLLSVPLTWQVRPVSLKHFHVPE